MRTPRRAWTPPIPLTLVMAVAVASPFGLAGCNKVKELTGGKEEAEEQTEEPAPTEPQVEEPKAPEPPPEAKAELEVAKEAGLTEAALAPPPVPVVELTKVDDLLALAPTTDKGMVVIRDASVFLGYVDSAGQFAAGPVGRIAAAVGPNQDLVAMTSQFMAVKGQYDAAKASIGASGVHLEKGIILAETANDGGVIVYAGDKPDALPTLIKSMVPDFPGMVCKAVDSAPGYVACADNQAELDAYAPGGDAGAAGIRSRWATNMPGVNIDKSNIIADIPSEGIHFGVETPPGLLIVSMAAPQGDPEIDEMTKALAPASGKLLRSVQPGAGFVWGNISAELIAAEMLPDIQNDNAPQPVKDLASQFSGEFLLAGHYDPATVALQLGLKDDSAWPGVAAELDKIAGELQKEIGKEIKIPSAEWSIGMVDIPVGGQTVKALHAGLSGVPEADVLAQLTGLTIDGWVFASNGAAHIALGASPEAIGHLATAEADGPSPGLQAYLPGQLTEALAANQVSMIAHFPLDALHTPQTRELINTALKNVEEVKPDLVLAILDLASPISSGTMWVTQGGGKAQFHMAIQGIGHQADDEGKAAIAAALAVAGGGDPATAWGALVSQYPNSPRLATYKIRAGQTQAALVASGVGALVAAGALAYPVFEGSRNEAIAEELDVEDGAAEKAKEESKKPPKKKKKTEPKPDPTPDPTPDNTPDPTPDPEPEPNNPDGRPKPPPIIPVNPDGDKTPPRRIK
jgi:hypothetical protein